MRYDQRGHVLDVLAVTGALVEKMSLEVDTLSPTSTKYFEIPTSGVLTGLLQAAIP